MPQIANTFATFSAVGNREELADVLIVDGKIAAVGESAVAQAPSGTETLDASGQYVMPGGIDVHTHFNIDTGLARSCDDFFTGTRAAACGGTTTIIDHMGFGPNGCRLRHQLEVYRGYAAHPMLHPLAHWVRFAGLYKKAHNETLDRELLAQAMALVAPLQAAVAAARQGKDSQIQAEIEQEAANSALFRWVLSLDV